MAGDSCAEKIKMSLLDEATKQKTRLIEFYNKHETRLDIVFFVGGFIFDILLASELGDPASVIQQIVSLLIIASLIHFEVLYRNRLWKPSGFAQRAWEYRGLALHFLLGGLLNMYSLFYLKSASFFASAIFLVLLIGVILANELPAVKRSHVSFKVAMYCICLFSFVSMMFPFLLGFVGWVPFGLSIVTTLALFYLQYKLLKKTVTDDGVLFRSLMGPAAAVITLFFGFYILGLIPPVPLSVSEQGIYHTVEKKEGVYFLSVDRNRWSVFETFYAQPGDKIVFFAQIFSPSRFADQVFVQWSFNDPKHGWQTQDKIPLSIVGGRREGFRGYTVKSNYQPGEWRVQVLSTNGQEISRMYFDVVPIEKTETRTFSVFKR